MVITRPVPIKIAVALMVILAVLIVVSALADERPTPFLAWVEAGLWVLLAFWNSRGKKAARIIATLLALLVILLSTAMIIDVGGFQLLALTVVMIAAGIIFMLWRPASSRFYEDHS